MDTFDREKRDTKDPKTIGQQNKIVQEWWGFLSKDKKSEATQASERWNKLGAPKETHEVYRRKNLPSMAREFVDTVWRTMGVNVVRFAAHDKGDEKFSFETQPHDKRQVFSLSTEESKNWVLKGEELLVDYLLPDPEEKNDEDDEEVEPEISLDHDGNPMLPSWAGLKLKTQQNLARLVFQAAYAKFTNKPKAKVPWGLLIQSPLDYLDSECIPEDFAIQDPSKWTKADIKQLGTHWRSLENEGKAIVSFIDARKDDMPLEKAARTKASLSKKPWMNIEDSEDENSTTPFSDSEKETNEVSKQSKKTRGWVKNPPHEDSPFLHSSQDRIQFLKSLSIMPQYQELINIIYALPEVEPESSSTSEIPIPLWASWSWREKYLPSDLHTQHNCFIEAVSDFQTVTFASSERGMLVVLGFGLLLRECQRAQEVEADVPEMANLDFLLDSSLGVERMEDVLTSIRLVISRLEQDSGDELRDEKTPFDKKVENQGDERGTLEQADEQIQPTTSTGRKRKGSVADKKDEESGKRKRVKSKRALGEAF
ncbi:hypothetical protein SCLCIDRAFT_27142 [Scleroderma citrinum Foug A]|uniref:Uncharacterized protein n=1 Tax=Scleroderma citrinum Foug A TaxID=1036808 RepID=A0A0C3DU88_9AGAM|nr:hypothetical protein SCLCIDRAFT_27142 [Scleroderma citrinum Foug A]